MLATVGVTSFRHIILYFTKVYLYFLCHLRLRVRLHPQNCPKITSISALGAAMKHLFKLFPSILSEMFRNAKKLRNVWVAAAGFDELDLCHLEEVTSSDHSSGANYGNRCETSEALIWQIKLRSCLCLHHLRMIEAAAERKARHFQSPAASGSKGVSQISLMLLWYETEAMHGYAIKIV